MSGLGLRLCLDLWYLETDEEIMEWMDTYMDKEKSKRIQLEYLRR